MFTPAERKNAFVALGQYAGEATSVICLHTLLLFRYSHAIIHIIARATMRVLLKYHIVRCTHVTTRDDTTDEYTIMLTQAGFVHVLYTCVYMYVHNTYH